MVRGIDSECVAKMFNLLVNALFGKAKFNFIDFK